MTIFTCCNNPMAARNSILTFILAACYAAGYYLLQYVLHRLGIVPAFPNEIALLNWDAHWYHSIMENGYQYSAEEYSNSGFFALFPLLWRLLGVGSWGISVVNILLFAAGFALFSNLYRLRWADKLLWLTFPSMYIAFVPYAEALFVFLSALALWGMARNKHYLVWISLFLLSMTRPVAAILVPAFLIMEALTTERRYWWQALLRAFLLYCLPLLAGTLLFIWYQYDATGVWMAYFKAQSERWGRAFTVPVLPFGSAFGPRALWLNAAGLFLSFVTVLLLSGYAFKWLVRNLSQKDRIYVLSCLYFAGIGLLSVTTNTTWGSKGTNIIDMARYSFVTPFFWVLLHRFTINASYRWQDYVKVFLLLNVFWLCFESWQHIQKLLYFNLSSVFILAYMWQPTDSWRWLRYALLACAGVTFQVMALQWYMAWDYPG